MRKIAFFISGSFIAFCLSCCDHSEAFKAMADKDVKTPVSDTAEYYLLRPKLEKEYGYSHAEFDL